MIYGYVNLNGITPQSDGVLRDIEKTILWERCISEHFLRNAFSGIFLTNQKNKLSRDNIFFENKERNLIIFLDGFIYNLEAISKKLNSKGKILNAPELIAEAYLKWGKTFAEHLNGDFAICIYDKYKNQVLFYVDQLGIRPFAISIIDSLVYFSTDVIGLSKGVCRTQKIEPAYLLNIFLKAGHDFMLTPHKSIVRIKPGHYFCFSIEHQEMERFWFPERIKVDTSLTEKLIIQDLQWLLTDAIKIRADQKYSASAHVSGGLDSSIVAAYTRKAYANQKKFYGFSWSPEPTKTEKFKTNDERLRVLEICRQNNMIPIFANYKTDDYIAYVSEWRCPSELIWEKKIIAAAKEKGIDLIFSGWGGDEFISIANRGIDSDLLRNLDWKHFLKKFPIWSLKQFASKMRREFSFLLVKRRYSRNKAEPSVYCYLQKILTSNKIPLRKRFHHRSRRAVHLQLIAMNHLAARTGDWYVNGQLNGIEYRYPLLDIRIVEYMLKVPSRILVNGCKERLIFRKLGKGIVSDDVLNRLSKSDPANTNALSFVTKKATEQFMDEFNVFRENPDLNFVDFNKLKMDAETSVSPQKNKIFSTDIFYYLKKAHEFTKGYYS
jgi:asparagine synthase (glutamine-hydrolysing)